MNGWYPNSKKPDNPTRHPRNFTWDTDSSLTDDEFAQITTYLRFSKQTGDINERKRVK